MVSLAQPGERWPGRSLVVTLIKTKSHRSIMDVLVSYHLIYPRSRGVGSQARLSAEWGSSVRALLEDQARAKPRFRVLSAEGIPSMADSLSSRGRAQARALSLLFFRLWCHVRRPNTPSVTSGLTLSVSAQPRIWTHFFSFCMPFPRV